MEPKVNDHVLRLTGKVSLLEPAHMGHNYKIVIGGSITTVTDKDNNDGTINREYKFEPVQVEAISPLGQTIQSKDPRSKSKLFRACLYRNWKEMPNDLGDEEFYDLVMDYCIRNHTTLAEGALKEQMK